MFKYEYRTEFLFFRNQKSALSPGGWELSPLPTTPCPEPHPLKSLTWSSLKRSLHLPLPAPLEPPLSHTAGCTLEKKNKKTITHRHSGVHMMNHCYCFTCFFQIFLKVSISISEPMTYFEGLKAINSLLPLILCL